MADKKITDLQLRSSVEDTLNLPSDDGIQSYRVTALQIKNYVLSVGIIVRTMLADAVKESLVPVGAVSAYAGSSVPDGFLLCDGSAVSRTTYASLFAAISTAHGQGDGSTTFNLPDYRGRFLRGVAGGQTTDPDRALRTAMATGGATGDNVGSVQGQAFQTHTHTQNAHSHNIQDASAGGSAARVNVVALDRLYGGTGSTSYSLTAINTVAVNQNATASGATSQASTSETRPVNAGVNYLIKY